MPNAKIVNIDNKEYLFDSLSDAAKTQLVNLRVVDKEIARLKVQLAIAQTARSVFSSGVKNNLPATPVATETVAVSE